MTKASRHQKAMDWFPEADDWVKKASGQTTYYDPDGGSEKVIAKTWTAGNLRGLSGTWTTQDGGHLLLIDSDERYVYNHRDEQGTVAYDDHSGWPLVPDKDYSQIDDQYLVRSLLKITPDNTAQIVVEQTEHVSRTGVPASVE